MKEIEHTAPIFTRTWPKEQAHDDCKNQAQNEPNKEEGTKQMILLLIA